MNWIQLGNTFSWNNGYGSFKTSLSENGRVTAIGIPTANSGGSIEIYEYNDVSWNQLGNTIDSSAGDYRIGVKGIQLSGDGENIIFGDASSNNDTGVSRVYNYDSSSNEWLQKGSDISGENSGDCCGTSSTISYDGNTIAIGCFNYDNNYTNEGRIRIYQWNMYTSSWVQKGSDIYGGSDYAELGLGTMRLNKDGSILAVGNYMWPYQNYRGRVLVYEWNNINWVQLGGSINGSSVLTNFGFSLDLSDDGKTFISGGPGNQGESRVFQYDASLSNWSQLGTTISGENNGDLLGTSVHIDGSGSSIVVGNPTYDTNTDEGRIRIYDLSNNDWNLQKTFIGPRTSANYGKFTSFSKDGRVILIGDPYFNSNAGQALVYGLDIDGDGNADLNANVDIELSLPQEGFSSFESSCKLERLVDAFNELFEVGINITHRNLSVQANIDAIGYYTNYEKWNYVHESQFPLSISESIVDASFQISPHYPYQQLKHDLRRYLVEDFLGSARLSMIVKQQTNVLSNVMTLNSSFNSQILNILSPLTTDGVLYNSDYSPNLTNNFYQLLDNTKTSSYNPLRILLSNILNPLTKTNTRNSKRKEIFTDYVDPIMDNYYDSCKDKIFYLAYSTDSYDIYGRAIKNFCGPLFFDVSNALATNNAIGNSTLYEYDLLTKTFSADFGSYVFYALPTNVSGGYRTYESNNNLFADASSAIYTLIEDNTTKTLVDLASFNQKLIPFEFIDGDSINFIVNYDISHNNGTTGSRKYKVQIDMKSKYYDFVFDTNTYYVYYNITKYEGGFLTSDILGDSFQTSDDPSFSTLGWKFTFDVSDNTQTETITSFYKSSLPHLQETYNISQTNENTSNNYTSGVSDLKMNQFMTSYYVDICGSDFAWKTNDISNTITDPFISDASNIGIHSPSDPIFVLQFILDSSLNHDNFCSVQIDSFTNHKKYSASGLLSFDYRIIMGPNNIGDLSENTNLFLVYPPDKISVLQNDVSNNSALYDVSGYEAVYKELYINSIIKNDDSGELLNNESIQWNTNTDVAKINVILNSSTTNEIDLTLRSGILNANSSKINYVFYKPCTLTGECLPEEEEEETETSNIITVSLPDNVEDYWNAYLDMSGSFNYYYLGWSVDVNDDGTRIVIGSGGSSHHTDLSSGIVQVFSYENNTWTQVGQSIKDGIRRTDLNTQGPFGSSVHMNNTGNVIAVGDPRYIEGDNTYGDHGRINVYEYINNTWTQRGDSIVGISSFRYTIYLGGNSDGFDINNDGTRLICGQYNGDYDRFGTADGNNKASAGRVFEYSDGSWNQIGQNIGGDLFKNRHGRNRCRLDGTGNRAVISSLKTGAYVPTSGSPAVPELYVYDYNSSTDTWVMHTNSDGSGNFALNDWGSGGAQWRNASSYANSIDMSEDGNIIVIGEHKYVNTTKDISDQTIGSPGSTGRAIIMEYDTTNQTWSQKGGNIIGQKLLYENEAQRVSISRDGSTVFLATTSADPIDASGNYNSTDNYGQVRVFKFSTVTNDWYQFGLDFEGTSTYNTGSTLASNYDGSVFITGSNPFGTPGRTGRVRGYSSYDYTYPTIFSGDLSGSGQGIADISGILIVNDDNGNVSFSVIYGPDLSGALVSLSTPTNTSSTQTDVVWTYTPSSSFDGSDNFTIQTVDPDGFPSTQVISIIVDSLPTTFSGDISGSGQANTDISGTLIANDNTGNVSFDVISGPNLSGVIVSITTVSISSTQTNAIWVYTPSASSNGSDSFTIEATDSNDFKTTQEISITIDDSPTTLSGDISGSGNVSTDISGTLTANDVNGNVTFAVSSTPNLSGASVSLSTPTNTSSTQTDVIWTYTPSSSTHGSDSFTIQSTDPNGFQSTQAISITVDDSPTTFSGDTTGTGTVSANITGTLTADDDNGNVSFSVISGPTLTSTSVSLSTTNVSSTQTNVLWSYVPHSSSYGSDSFTIRSIDPNGFQATQAISITVNDSPTTISGDISGSGEIDTDISGTIIANDDNGNVSFSVVSNPSLSGASVSLTTTNISSTQTNVLWNYDSSGSGTDSFTIRATDTNSNITDTAISITVNEPAVNYTYLNYYFELYKWHYYMNENKDVHLNNNAGNLDVLLNFTWKKLYFDNANASWTPNYNWATSNNRSSIISTTPHFINISYVNKRLVHPSFHEFGGITEDMDVPNAGFTSSYFFTEDPTVTKVAIQTGSGLKDMVHKDEPLNVYLSFTHPDNIDSNTAFYPIHFVQSGSNFIPKIMLLYTFPEYYTSDEYSRAVSELSGMSDIGINNIISGNNFTYSTGNTTVYGGSIISFTKYMYFYAGPQTYFSTATSKVTSLNTDTYS